MAAVVVSVPDYEGICVTNERDVSAAGSNSLHSTPVPEVSEDITSVKGIFGWESVHQCFLPYIIRTINGQQETFVSTRIAEIELLNKYINLLNPEIYTCTSVRGHLITQAEAELLNKINSKHNDDKFGEEKFTAGKDYVVRLFDVIELCSFIDFFYKKLLCRYTLGPNEKCGFIRINSEFVLPYYVMDNKKYLPLIFFEGETDHPMLPTKTLEGWDLAYFKFYCKMENLKEKFVSDSYIVVSLDDIKNLYPPETNYEEVGLVNSANLDSCLVRNNSHVNPPNSWFRAPPPMVGGVMGTCATAAAVPEAAAVQQQEQLAATASTGSVSVAGMVPQQQQVMAMGNGGTSNQRVNSCNTQHQLPPTYCCYCAMYRNQNAVTQTRPRPQEYYPSVQAKRQCMSEERARYDGVQRP